MGLPWRITHAVETPIGVREKDAPTLYDSGVELRFDRSKITARVGSDFVAVVRATGAAKGEVVTLAVANFRFPGQFPPRVYELVVV